MSCEEEVERLQAELAEANEAYLATVKAAHESGMVLQRRAERAEAKCGLTEAAANRWYAAHEQAEAAVGRARVLARRLLASDLPDAQADGRLLLQALDGRK